jgi:hypothetical protein
VDIERDIKSEEGETRHNIYRVLAMMNLGGLNIRKIQYITHGRVKRSRRTVIYTHIRRDSSYKKAYNAQFPSINWEIFSNVDDKYSLWIAGFRILSVV